MMRIEFINNVPHVEGRPIPPYPYILRQEAELVVRLRSTRGRIAADWWAGDEARRALNRAPFNPVIRAVVHEFAWTPPGRYSPIQDEGEYCRNNPRIPPHPRVVAQWGKKVPHWRALVVRPLPDPDREVVQAAWAAVASRPWLRRQGGLLVWDASVDLIARCLPLPAEEAWEAVERALERGLRSSGWVYNHVFYPHNGLLFRVIDAEKDWPMGVGVVRVWKTCYVLSPDHPGEPLILYGGLHVFAHPLPREGVD